MTNDTTLFQINAVSTWLEKGGLLVMSARKRKPRDRPIKTRKERFFFEVIAASVIGLSIAFTPLAKAEQTQLTLTWPAQQTSVYTRQSLADAIHSLKTLQADWNGHDAPAPKPESIKAAEYILPQLPNVIAEANAGVDGNGNVYLKLARGDKVALVTIEPRLVHFLCMEPGKPNVYIDDEQFKGKKLPASIKRALTTTFT